MKSPCISVNQYLRHNLGYKQKIVLFFVYNMKSPVELNSLLSKFFCYITWFVIPPVDATLDDLQTRPLCQILFLRNNSLAV